MGKRNENKQKMVKVAGNLGYIISHRSHLSKDSALRLRARKDEFVKEELDNLLISLNGGKKNGKRPQK